MNEVKELESICEGLIKDKAKTEGENNRLRKAIIELMRKNEI